MPWRTSTNEEGPYLVITKTPANTTNEQINRALEAAHAVFRNAGYDPVQVGMRDTEDAFEEALFDDLWAAAENAATEAVWAPRAGTSEPTGIKIYFE